jgi:hypothetical protein
MSSGRCSKKGTDYYVPRRRNVPPGAASAVDRAVCPLFRPAPGRTVKTIKCFGTVKRNAHKRHLGIVRA